MWPTPMGVGGNEMGGKKMPGRTSPWAPLKEKDKSGRAYPFGLKHYGRIFYFCILSFVC